jgi:hypothetical protein
MLQGEALRRRGERSSPLQVCFDFATSLFGLGSARVSRVGDRVLAIADFSAKIVSARRRKSEPDWHATRDACATQNHLQRVAKNLHRRLSRPQLR